MNQLAIRQEDANILLHQKNILDEQVIDKYRTAGTITETGLNYAIDLINQIYHFKSRQPLSVSQLCLMIDSLLVNMLSKVYLKCEKSITNPTSFNVNEVVSNFSPELDDSNEYFFKEGDIITINLGVQIDGYNSNVSHTICIYPPGDKPIGPLLGGKADSIIANYLCTKIVIALLGLSMTPEKLPLEARKFGNVVNGSMIKHYVNYIAEQFNCRVIPGSEIRQIRRFLSGQNELLEEKGYKGIKWYESDEEINIINKLGGETNSITKIFGEDTVKHQKGDEEFIIKSGEIYQINLKVASINDFNEIGIITTETINEYTGVNNKVNEFKMKPTIFIRDFIMNYKLKLKASRNLISKIDKKYSVYPFKLNYLTSSFPMKNNSLQEMNEIKSQILDNKLGLNEILNHNLVNAKPIQVIKFLPYKSVLDNHSVTSMGVNVDKLIKNSNVITDKSIESTTVLINNLNNELIQLSNNFEPVYCQSQFKLVDPTVEQLFNSLNGKFGVKVKKVNALPIKEQMDLD
ncbi:probable metalloprotease Arx1p [[Candida] jaroonii]|uniref:Probable metalloprotease Arx1p n=1 Tax=[Candida] jaroonii TaxID=467808 RepID=A0ACA9YDU2_9ASCO|nr:probable metalloprotease Arx1p [[Candida] jaroonii]